MARNGAGRYGSGMTRSLRSALAGGLAVFLACSAMAACSDDDPRPPPAGDGKPVIVAPGGNTEGGVPVRDASTSRPDASDAGFCSNIELRGFVLDREGVTGEPPTATGGTVTDGDYDLASYVVYVGLDGVAGPTGITARASIRIAGDTLEQILETGGNTPSATVISKTTFSAISTTFAETQICPSPGAGSSRQFNASGSQLTLTNLTTKEAFTFTKR